MLHSAACTCQHQQRATLTIHNAVHPLQSDRISASKQHLALPQAGVLEQQDLSAPLPLLKMQQHHDAAES
jgi:hypothetical protein